MENYIKKGLLVHIEAKMQTRSYTDQSGVERRVNEFVVKEINILTPKAQRQEPDQPLNRTQVNRLTDSRHRKKNCRSDNKNTGLRSGVHPFTFAYNIYDSFPSGRKKIGQTFTVCPIILLIY